MSTQRLKVRRMPADRLPAGQLAQLTVYPGRGRGLFVLIRVFGFRNEMLDYWRDGCRKGKGPEHDDIAGVFLPAGIMTARHATAMVGEVLLNLADLGGNLGAEIVPHELLHATFAWAGRCRLDLTEAITDVSLQERVCYAHGWMVGEFWRVYEEHAASWRAAA